MPRGLYHKLKSKRKNNLIVTSAKYKLGIGILAEYPSDDLVFVHRKRSCLQILLVNEHFNRPFTNQVILQEVLAFSAMEKTTTRSKTNPCQHKPGHGRLTPFRITVTVIELFFTSI